MENDLLVIVVVVVGVLLYFIPSFIAFTRDHDSLGWIIFLNIVLGWTGLGWLFCLVWAAFGRRK